MKLLKKVCGSADAHTSAGLTELLTAHDIAIIASDCMPININRIIVCSAMPSSRWCCNATILANCTYNMLTFSLQSYGNN